MTKNRIHFIATSGMVYRVSVCKEALRIGNIRLSRLQIARSANQEFFEMDYCPDNKWGRTPFSSYDSRTVFS